MLPVYAKDWLQQPQKVMEQVLRALGDNTATIPLGTSGPQDHPAFRRLVLGEKWWEAATDSRQPIVRYGRSGSKGQITLRTFPDEGSARDELERQLEEQRQKGFVAETREPPQTWEPQTWEPPKA